jgi:hypothetical protein
VHFSNDRPRSVEELNAEIHSESAFSCSTT